MQKERIDGVIMFSEIMQVSFDKIMQTRSYTVVILAGQGKRFAIYTEPHVGKILQMYLTDVERMRPSTHDLMAYIFKGLDIRVKQVVITDVEDTVYYARLFLEQQKGDIREIIELDARPSDCITLALIQNAPVYCTKEILEKVIPVEE